jgi:hypothetical protein
VLVDESVAAVGFQRDVGRGPAGLRGEVFGHVGIGAALLAPSSARWQLMDQDRAAQSREAFAEAARQVRRAVLAVVPGTWAGLLARRGIEVDHAYHRTASPITSDADAATEVHPRSLSRRPTRTGCISAATTPVARRLACGSPVFWNRSMAWRANRVAEVRSPPARYVISDRRASPSPRRLPARR